MRVLFHFIAIYVRFEAIKSRDSCERRRLRIYDDELQSHVARVSHFLLKEDRKKLKVEKEGSDVYEQNEPQIEKADQGEIPLSIGILRWERKLKIGPFVKIDRSSSSSSS
ncbi:hypothetical protein QVD17_04723 [Tagetes erecta]|uniref:Uncharacterized protein n=1 Tax=Tagetes erecta TaxID=13708 RepID=A0AAD8LH86_TARER|nr:hypothetical protein QVD17_04723 [Tagetes erecta]